MPQELFWFFGILIWVGVEWVCMAIVPSGTETAVVMCICSAFIFSWGFVSRKIYKYATRELHGRR